jgi:threonine dehydratase
MDSLQITGSFKLRGVMNFLLRYKEKNGSLPQKIVCYTTGNHGIAASYAAQLFNIELRVYIPNNVLEVKKQLLNCYKNTEVIIVNSRQKAEELTAKDAKENGYCYLATSDDMDILNGAATCFYEAALQMKKQNFVPNKLFVPCGGGGLVTSSYLAKNELKLDTDIIACEPFDASDLYLSKQNNNLFKFPYSPVTIADGLKALCISNLAFQYINKINSVIRVKENRIRENLNMLNKVLPSKIEPSSAVAFAGLIDFIKRNNIKNENILVIITGGNVKPFRLN